MYYDLSRVGEEEYAGWTVGGEPNITQYLALFWHPGEYSSSFSNTVNQSTPLLSANIPLPPPPKGTERNV